MFTPLGCKYMDIGKFMFVAKTQFLTSEQSGSIAPKLIFSEQSGSICTKTDIFRTVWIYLHQT